MFFVPVSDSPTAMVFMIAGYITICLICGFFENKWRQRNPVSYLYYKDIYVEREVGEMLDAQKSPRIWFRKKPKGIVLQNDCLPEDIIGDSNLKPIDIGQLVRLVGNRPIKGIKFDHSDYTMYILLKDKDCRSYLISYCRTWWGHEDAGPFWLRVCDGGNKIHAGSILVTA